MPPWFSAFENDAPSTIKKDDTEGLLDAIKKYAPIVYLDKDEIFGPIWVDEYFTAPTTSLKSHLDSNAGPYLKGKITFERMYDIYTCNAKNKSGFLLYADIAHCTRYGSDPKRKAEPTNHNVHGLSVPIYVITSQQRGNYYIQYITWYGYNGPYNIGLFTGSQTFGGKEGSTGFKVDDIREAHEADIEHFTVELDKNKNLKRVYFGSHGNTEGFWLDGNDARIQWENNTHNRSKKRDDTHTHPVVYSAHYGHGTYPAQGTWVRIFGMANDVTTEGDRWSPTRLIRVYKDTDQRFDKKTMGWLYGSGSNGEHGIQYTGLQGWFGNSQGDPNAVDENGKPVKDDSEKKTGGDVGREHGKTGPDLHYCPPQSDDPIGNQKLLDCIADMIPKAGMPD